MTRFACEGGPAYRPWAVVIRQELNRHGPHRKAATATISPSAVNDIGTASGVNEARIGSLTPTVVPLLLKPHLSQEELAGWLGTSRSTVARMFHSMRDQGLIRTGYRSITITAPEQLRKTAHATW